MKCKAPPVDKLTSRLDVITFSMVLCHSTNAISSIGWYVDNGALRHMTYDINNFNMFQEKEGLVLVELGGDATYHVKGLGSIYFHMHLGGIVELYPIFYVFYLTKNLF